MGLGLGLWSGLRLSIRPGLSLRVNGPCLGLGAGLIVSV